MAKRDYKYIYGPVSSWRLGRSLGIDPISARVKICNFNCVYCQLGRTGRLIGKRKVFVPAEKVIKEIESLPPLEVDYITFSGAGEPTLAKNLGRMIKAVKKVRNEKIAVLTNSSLIDRRDVQRDLLLADFIVAKLDVSSQELFKEVNHPIPGLRLDRVVKGLKEFKARFKGRLVLQIMFVKKNMGYAREIAGIAKDIGPDKVQINTPLRPSAVRPLSKREIERIKPYFKGMNIISVYDVRRKKVKSIGQKQTLRRRGRF